MADADTTRLAYHIPEDLTIGKRVNVRTADSPMYRVLTALKEKDGWLYWYWIPESPTPEGTPDCGYSGVDCASDFWDWS